MKRLQMIQDIVRHDKSRDVGFWALRRQTAAR